MKPTEQANQTDVDGTGLINAFGLSLILWLSIADVWFWLVE
jgi:hypothetical protein